MPYGRDELNKIAIDLVGKNYAVWNIEYRRLGEPGAGWPRTLQDVVSAINHLESLVKIGIDLDLNRVIVAGHSAGGHLALCASARKKAEKLLPLVRLQPLAAVGLAAITDLSCAFEMKLGNGAVNEFLGGSPNQYPERYETSSPIMLLPIGVKQLIIHGEIDKAIPIEMSRSYATAAKATGDDVEIKELPDVGHMEFIDPNSKAHLILCRWLAKEVKAI